MKVQEFVSPDDLRGVGGVAERVHQLMLSGIVDGHLVASDGIRDHDWAEALGVSRTPVREAIQRLHGAGLLEIAAARYTRLRAFTPEAAREEEHDWMLLHHALIRSIIPRVPNGLIDALHRTHRTFLEQDHPTHTAAASFDYFHTLRAAAPTSAITLGAAAAAYRYRLAQPALPHPLATDTELHTGIITALVNRDPDHAHHIFTRWIDREHYTTAA